MDEVPAEEGEDEELADAAVVGALEREQTEHLSIPEPHLVQSLGNPWPPRHLSRPPLLALP